MSSPLDHPPANRRLGDFEIVREVGRGGMGVVYEARQVSLNRKVALKVLSGGLGLSPKAVPRFRREAEAAAKLHHTNIVPVYATGEENGTHFYAMELIDGPSLDAVIRDLASRERQRPEPATPVADAPGSPQHLDATGPYVEGPNPSANGAAALTSSSLSSDGHYFDTVAKMVADVADALDYAHKEGVIHRDIKPSNLLLSPDGRLSINDFGLARLLEQPGMTMTGEFVGTPAYMSPEQITAGRVPVDHRTDIYSLGATLYELLTLRPPFTGERRDQLLAQILHKDPKAPRRVNRKVPVDLETICLKAMDKDPDRRYQSAGELAADLRRYVNRFAIAARRAGPVERLRKWVKRRPGLAAALALLVVAVGVAGYFGYRAYRAEQMVQAERRQNALEKATEAALSGDLERARKAIVEAEAAGVSADQVHWLNGLVHFQRGAYAAAIKEFESALALKPSAAAQAMLARAHFNMILQSGNPSILAFRKAMNDLDPMEPVTAEDYMCKGYAIGLFDGKKSMELLDTAVAMRDSPIARAFRASAAGRIAADKADPQLTERMLDDMRQARKRLPDNSFIRCQSLHGYMHAADRYGETDEPAQKQDALKEAKSDAQALENIYVLDYVMARVYYFEHVGDQETAVAVLKQAAAREETKELVTQYALALYRQDRVEEALDALNRGLQPENVMGQALRIILMAEHREFAPEKAYSEYVRVADRRERETGSRFLGPNAFMPLLLLRKRAEAAKVTRDTDRIFGLSEGESPLARYLAKSITEEEYLEEHLKSGRGGRLWACFGHYVIGLVRLSEGDRAGAQEHFQKSVDTNFYANIVYPYARVFLERLKRNEKLKRDEQWPRWIPVKE
jgi:serine/threonine protein kinase